MRKIAFVVLMIFSLSIFPGCAPQRIRPDGSVESNVGYCALAGAGIGAGIGAATRLRQPLPNAFIGGILGAIAGIALCQVIENESRRAAIEAARTNRPIQYRTNQGQQIMATPSGYNPNDGCRDIVNEAWDTDGTPLGKVTRRVCPDQYGTMQIHS